MWDIRKAVGVVELEVCLGGVPRAVTYGTRNASRRLGTDEVSIRSPAEFHGQAELWSGCKPIGRLAHS